MCNEAPIIEYLEFKVFPTDTAEHFATVQSSQSLILNTETMTVKNFGKDFSQLIFF